MAPVGLVRDEAQAASGQLTASGGALRVDAMLGIGQQTLPGSIRPPGSGQGTGGL
jgi:hypothetical protein